MTKKIIATIVVGILTVSSIGYVIYSKPERDLKKELAQYGHIEKQRIEVQNGNRVEKFKGEQIVVYENDYDAVTNELVNLGIAQEQAESDAEKMLLREEALYILAKNAGTEVSDEEVMNIIQLNKEQSQKASNYNEFKIFLDGANMTADEYWDSQFVRLKKKMTVSEYKDNYLKKNGKYQEFNDRTQQYVKLVEDEFNEIADDFIKKDNITRVAS